MADGRFTSFAEFWPFYLREHAKPATRAMHYAGTTLALMIAVAAVVTGNWWWILVTPLVGYAFAWIAHFKIEHNRPATFGYPLWSFLADYKMWGYWLTGRLGPELRRAGVATPADSMERSR